MSNGRYSICNAKKIQHFRETHSPYVSTHNHTKREIIARPFSDQIRGARNVSSLLEVCGEHFPAIEHTLNRLGPPQRMQNRFLFRRRYESQGCVYLSSLSLSILAWLSLLFGVSSPHSHSPCQPARFKHQLKNIISEITGVDNVLDTNYVLEICWQKFYKK